jgi:hypothetical protein
MTTLLCLLALLLMQQPARPEFGTISGRLRDSNGAPAAGIRVAVMPVEGDVAVARASATLSSISQTDSSGLYRLENVPPGRYLIMAGLLAFPSYYPGVTAPPQARIVTIGAGQDLINLDFAIVTVSNTVVNVVAEPGRPPITGRISVDDGSPLPAWPVQLMPSIEVRGRAGIVTSLKVNQLARASFAPYLPADFSITRLPLGYYLKSMTFGTVDLTKGPLNPPLNPAGGQFEVVLTKTPPVGSPPHRKVGGRILGLDFPLSADFELALRDLSIVGPGPSQVVAHVKAGRQDGVFEIENVPPGKYILQEPFSSSSKFLSLTFEVSANDVTNLELRYLPRETLLNTAAPVSAKVIKGTVEVKDALIPEFEIGFMPTRFAVTHAVAVSGGEFSIALPAGEYRVSIAGLPMGYSVTSVTAGPLDLAEPFIVTDGSIADRFTSKPVGNGGITVKLKVQ